LSRDGTLQLSFQAYAVLPAMPQRIVLARAPIDPADPFLYHKTTQRHVYQQALAARPGWDDVLLYNSRGEITESTIANVVVEIEGAYYTPPLRCGLLPGTHREALLACRQLRERVMTVEQLLTGARIYLINSVRGIGQVELYAGPD
jgi:para-aminobenzoate synthetase/4-amino-4-deoxychorismate lyase